MTLLRKGNNTKNISATVNMSLREDIMKLWLPREPEEAVQQHVWQAPTVKIAKALSGIGQYLFPFDYVYIWDNSHKISWLHERALSWQCCKVYFFHQKSDFSVLGYELMSNPQFFMYNFETTSEQSQYIYLYIEKTLPLYHTQGLSNCDAKFGQFLHQVYIFDD